MGKAGGLFPARNQTDAVTVTFLSPDKFFVMFRDDEMVSGAGGAFFTGMLSMI